MKAKKITSTLKSVLIGTTTLILILFFSSCTPRIPFNPSSVVPAAEGYVTVKTDKNLNYKIQINVSNLADVYRLKPLAYSYVAWIVTEQDSVKNIGGIITSNHLNVVLKTVSSFKPVQIMITAEEDAEVQRPIGQMVLTTEIF